MKLDTHIVKRFLTDPHFNIEIIEGMYPDVHDIVDGKITEPRVYKPGGYDMELPVEEIKMKIASLYKFLETPKNHKPFYCTETMIECLDLLIIKKKGEHYDWTYFKKLQDQVATFIFPDNSFLRMVISGDTITFFHLHYTSYDKINGNMQWTMFYLNRVTGETCEHFSHEDVKAIEKFIYSLLCFVYLSENEEVIVAPNSKHGTRKSGKIINTTPFAITIINSKWNITSIRTEGFYVDPHFAIRWVGRGRTEVRIVLIGQYEKQGYVRKAKPENFGKS